MNQQEYRDFLLSHIPGSKPASGGSMINCRCRYCPDSRDPKSKHMYISIPKNDREPSFYYCHKCHASGIVTNKTLLDWNIYEDNIAVALIELNRNAKRYSKNTKYFASYYNLTNPIPEDNELNRIKLNYIRNRIGYPITYQECKDYKIALSLNDLLRVNRVEQLTRAENIVEQLDGNFLGFISIDNAFLNMRRLCEPGLLFEGIDKRYINYKIFDKFDTSERFYTIPTSIDLTAPSRIKINIAEGPFDILSIYLNVRNKEPGIYTSIAGSNYYGQALYFLERFKLPYVELHFYPDNDNLGSANQMNIVANNLKELDLSMPIYIHRNMYPNEKDFGVDPSHIQESIMRLN
jgi:hypothetical protein